MPSWDAMHSRLAVVALNDHIYIRQPQAADV